MKKRNCFNAETNFEICTNYTNHKSCVLFVRQLLEISSVLTFCSAHLYCSAPPFLNGRGKDGVVG